MMDMGEDEYGLIFNSIFNVGSSSKLRTYSNTVNESMESITYPSGNRLPRNQLRGSVDVPNTNRGYKYGGKGSKGCKHRKNSNGQLKGRNGHGGKGGKGSKGSFSDYGGKGGKGSKGSVGYYVHIPCDQSPNCINYGGNCCHSPTPSPLMEPTAYTNLEWCEDDDYDWNGPNYSGGENPNFPNKYPGWDNPNQPGGHQHDPSRPGEHQQEHDPSQSGGHQQDPSQSGGHQQNPNLPGEHQQEHDPSQSGEHQQEHDSSQSGGHQHDLSRPGEHYHDPNLPGEYQHGHDPSQSGGHQHQHEHEHDPTLPGGHYHETNHPGGHEHDHSQPGGQNSNKPTSIPASSAASSAVSSAASSAAATFEEPSVSPTMNPTVTIAPSESSAPSSKPSVSQIPSSSSAPSNMPSTSLEPSRSNAPSEELSITPSSDPNAPGPTLIPGNNIADGNVGAKNYCMIFPAKYETVQIDESSGDIRTDNVILLWASGTDRDKEATAIAALNSIVPTPIYESDTDKFDVNVVFKIKLSNAVMNKDDIDNDQDFDLEDVSKYLDEIVNPPVVLAVAGCVNEAQEMATEYYYEHQESNRRKTQVTESESKLAVMRHWICVYSNGSTCIDDECSVSCKTSINYMGNLEYKDSEPIIAQSLNDYFSMIDNVSTWYDPQVINYTIEEGSTDYNDNGIAKATDVTEIEQQKSSTKAGPYIGAAAGLLALLLFLLCFVRRRNRYFDDDEVSHLKLDDGDDDDTFVREFGLGGDGGSDDNSIPRNEYQSRDIHIVGEDDSVISHWTGYTGRDHPTNGNYEMEYIKNGPLNGIATDVHQCASATCEICAKNRQAGLSFVSAGANGEPTRSRSLPSDASREYPVEDTVEL